MSEITSYITKVHNTDSGTIVLYDHANAPGCKIMYEVFDTNQYLENLKKGENFPNRNFMIDDVVGLLGDDGVKVVKTIVNILYIRTKENLRNQMSATNLMREFLKEFEGSDDTIVLFRAAATKDDYLTEPTDEQYQEFFNRVMKFLMPFGFHSIQALCGLEFSEPYLYTSSISGASKVAWNKFVDYWYEEHSSKLNKGEKKDGQ